MLRLIIWLLLLSTAYARTPSEIVMEVFEYATTHGDSETLKAKESCFTPGFLGVVERALAKKPGGNGAFIDMNYFFCTQDSGFKVGLDKSETTGKDASVYLKHWQGPYRGAPSQPPPAQATIKVLLTDMGQGFQIMDWQHLPQPFKYPDGHTEIRPGIRSVRADLGEIGAGRWPKH